MIPAESMETQVSASRAREEERSIEPRRDGFQGVQHSLTKRDGP